MACWISNGGRVTSLFAKSETQPSVAEFTSVKNRHGTGSKHSATPVSVFITPYKRATLVPLARRVDCWPVLKTVVDQKNDLDGGGPQGRRVARIGHRRVHLHEILQSQPTMDGTDCSCQRSADRPARSAPYVVRGLVYQPAIAR